MSHFMYVLLFLVASSAMASLLQAENREEFPKLFVKRITMPLAAFAGVSWDVSFGQTLVSPVFGSS